jgi:hypothetical protein
MEEVAVMNPLGGGRGDAKGPCRESALTLLEGQLAGKMRETAGLAALVAFVKTLQIGSPAEEYLWEMAVAARSRSNF